MRCQRKRLPLFVLTLHIILLRPCVAVVHAVHARGLSSLSETAHASLNSSGGIGAARRPFLATNSHSNVDPLHEREGAVVNQSMVGLVPECATRLTATLHSDWNLKCPSECPLYAEHPGGNCEFSCVGATIQGCRSVNKRQPVPDIERGTCRACSVRGCALCALDGTDSCLVCAPAHHLIRGVCINKFVPLWIAVAAAIVLAVLFVCAWIRDLFLRRITNLVSLEHGLIQRSRSKLHKPKECVTLPTERKEGTAPQVALLPPIRSDSSNLLRMGSSVTMGPAKSSTKAKVLDTARELWPLSTNLCTEEVAGPGLLLSFHFQASVLGWAVFILASFVAVALWYDLDLLINGTRAAETPWENCILLQLGRKNYTELNLPMAYFVAVVYVVSFVSSIAYGLFTQATFRELDVKYTTHKDFCAKLKKIPELTESELLERHGVKGDCRLEQVLADLVANATESHVIGVSICWSYGREGAENLANWFERVVEMDLVTLEENAVKNMDASDGTEAAEEESEHQETSQNSSWFYEREDKVLGVEADAAADASVKDAQKLLEALNNLRAAGEAFVVFNTEGDRNEAVATCQKKGGIEFGGAMLALNAALCEPESVQWSNYGCSRTRMMLVKRTVVGVGAIALALFFWAALFYMPYVLFISSVNYEFEEPNLFLSTLFSMLVVLGNALMYLVCSEVADRIGFLRKDDREVCYMVLYTMACLFNVVLDLVVTYWMAYSMMSAGRLRAFDGTLISRVQAFPDAYTHTYVLPREVGNQFVYYALGTFPIPALVEPWVTIYIPYQIMTLVVRSHTTINRERAEKFMGAFQMDLSRYADLLLNLILMSLAFFLPSGFIFSLLLLLIASHVCIYVFDHWRVLRSVPSCIFTSLKVDRCAQLLLSIPCGVLLTCAIWRARCDLKDGHSCDDGSELVKIALAAFIAHVTLHVALVLCFIPLFRKSDKVSDLEYKDHCARRLPASWFSCNPVHCLRSKYKFNHKPPCDYWVPGKEHLMRVNEEMGLYFHDVAIKAETFEQSPAGAVGSMYERLHRYSSVASDPATMSNAVASLSLGLPNLWRDSSADSAHEKQ